MVLPGGLLVLLLSLLLEILVGALLLPSLLVTLLLSWTSPLVLLLVGAEVMPLPPGVGLLPLLLPAWLVVVDTAAAAAAAAAAASAALMTLVEKFLASS
jgi:hypothetical protein